MQLQHQQHFQAKKNINHKVPKDAPRLHQLNSTQLNSTQLNSTQLNSTQLNSTQLNSTQLGWAGLGWAGQGRAGQGRAGQETDHALEKNFLPFESCALLFMLLPSKVVSRCSWESNQATCQSGEWEEPEKQETYTHRRKHSTMNITI